MLKLGLLLGGLIGALIATLLATPKEEAPVAEVAPKNVVDKVRLQVHEAQVAVQAEMKAKEAEMLAEYEATLHAKEERS